MAFQRASLREALVALCAFVRLYSSMCSDVALQVEGIVESLPAEVAFVLFKGRVVPSVTVEHPDVFESLAAEIAGVVGEIGLGDCSALLLFNFLETGRMNMLMLMT